jgi:hypothetical protein
MDIVVYGQVWARRTNGARRGRKRHDRHDPSADREVGGTADTLPASLVAPDPVREDGWDERCGRIGQQRCRNAVVIDRDR